MAAVGFWCSVRYLLQVKFLGLCPCTYFVSSRDDGCCRAEEAFLRWMAATRYRNTSASKYRMTPDCVQTLVLGDESWSSIWRVRLICCTNEVKLMVKMVTELQSPRLYFRSRTRTGIQDKGYPQNTQQGINEDNAHNGKIMGFPKGPLYSKWNSNQQRKIILVENWQVCYCETLLIVKSWPCFILKFEMKHNFFIFRNLIPDSSFCHCDLLFITVLEMDFCDRCQWTRRSHEQFRSQKVK